MSRPALFVVIPVFNEAGNMPRLMAALKEIEGSFAECATRIVLVDDGSGDDTVEMARAQAAGLDLTVLAHGRNRGPGAAFATAFTWLAPQLAHSDWVLTIEGDNTSRLELVRQMMTRMGEGFDVVLASPYLYGGGFSNTSLLRIVLSHLGNLFVKEALGLHGIVTMSSFFRLYRGRILLQLQAAYGPAIIERRGFESMIEMLLKLVHLEATISEIAMKLDTGRRVGKSKMKILRTSLGYLTLVREKRRWLSVAAAPAIAGAAGAETR